MKLKQLIALLGAKLLTQGADLERELHGCYICDLLSYVMSHAEKDNVWITVQTNLNVVAVASLTEVGCVILPENIEPEELTLQKAETEGVILLSARQTAYEIAAALAGGLK